MLPVPLPQAAEEVMSNIGIVAAHCFALDERDVESAKVTDMAEEAGQETDTILDEYSKTTAGYFQVTLVLAENPVELAPLSW